MIEEIDEILRELNNLDEVIWRLFGKAVEHQDHELRILVGNLNSRIDEISDHVILLKGEKDEARR